MHAHGLRNGALCLVLTVLAACAGVSPRVTVTPRDRAPTATRTESTVATKPAADYTVVRGDTLYGIAFRNKLDFRDLAAWNNIAAPYTIFPGQGLRLSPPSPTTRVASNAQRPLSPPVPVSTPTPTPTPPPAPAQTEAPPVPVQPVTTPVIAASDDGATQTYAVIDDVPPATTAKPLDAPPEPKPVTPTMAPGKPTTATIASPAAAIGLSPAAPKPVDPPKPVATAAVAASTASPSAPVTPTTVAQPQPSTSADVVDSAPRAVVDPRAPTRHRDGVHWRWPSGGPVIGRFIDGDPTQQGIDIGGALGQTVLAAADGDVVYSGNGLIGYGELVIVQHSPGFLSAYGHNQKRLVIEGSKVKAGQPIAEMGRRGGIDMLHFEIRRNGKPVDPLIYLPSR